MTVEPESGRVLVVDDDEAVGRLIHRVLSARHETVVEPHARVALVRLEGGERFDLILCDVNMPGMSGIELYTHLRNTLPFVAARVVLMTGGGLDGGDARALAALGARTLDKPFTPAVLRALVQDLTTPGSR